jgi:signal transduction histidine kinase/ligand-binding sensor domain-containing protein/DNA-binding response OmpR family regulator
MILRKIYLLTVFLCGLLLPHESFSHSHTVKHLGVEDGLSNNYVKDIVQDRQGCVWVATISGLNCFDGRTFTVYNNINSALPGNALNALLYDETDNRLWIGSIGGVCVLDCSSKTFENISAPEGIVIKNVVGLAKAADGGIWIVNHDDGIVYYNPETGFFDSYTDKTVKGLKNVNWCAFDDGRGNLYVGHAQEGLSIIDLKSRTARHFENQPGNPQSLPANSVYSICADRSGNIWVGTKQGLGLFNPKTANFLNFEHEPDNPHSLIADPVYCVREMADGTLWIAHDIGGISILDLSNITFQNPENVKFVTLSAESEECALSSNNIRNLLQDSFGNIWIGNYGSGLDFISHTPPVFRTLPYAAQKGYALKNKPVFSIYEDKNGQLYVGSENELALFKNNQLVRTFDISPYSSRIYTQIFAMGNDDNDNILLGLYDDGLLKFNSATHRFERITLDIKNVDIITFFKDNDRIWIGTEYGIYTYSNKTIEKQENINALLPDKSVYGILRDRQGKLWVGTYGGGIAIFDAENKLITTLSLKNGFCSNDVNSLYIDHKDGVWIATRDGLGYIKDTESPVKFELYNHRQGLKDNFIRAIHEDGKGNIWISSNSGISLWNAQTEQFADYDFHDGVPTGNFIEGAACLTAEGTLYFGSLGGVCFFNPAEIAKNRDVAPVQIINAIPDRHEKGNFTYKNGGLTLPYNQNTFRISFSVPDYSQNGQVEYAYLMENLDNEWHNTQSENQVTFRNAAPGKYTFKVKARLRNQEWDEQHIATMNVLISPPVWRTWYAKTLYVIIFMLLIYGVIRFYKRRLELESSLEIEKHNNLNEQELNQERLRFYTNITHELRTPLTLILGPLEDLLNDRKLPNDYNPRIKLIHDSATRLLNLITQILEFRKTETQNRRLTVARGDLGRLVTEIGLRYKELNRNKKVKFRISIETDRTTLYFDSEIIITILNNLLSNAVKYTPEGEISLTLSSVDEKGESYTQIRVSDTGYGISPDDLPRIFDRYYQAKSKHQASGTGIGLALVKSLADLHGAILSVESRDGEGTTFRFRILTNNTYADSLHREEKPADIIERYPEENITEENKDSLPIVLVVEDNDDIRNYIIQSLSGQYKTLSAVNGKEGLEQAQNRIPNIIVSDIMMPETDGIELCRKIKDDLRTSHIPVILLTAKDSTQDKAEGYKSGADSYLTKPFSSELLHARISNLLESRRKLAQQILSQAGSIKPEKTVRAPQINKLDEEFLQKTTAIIEKNISNDNLNLAFLTAQFNMSQSSLYRKVKGLTGISPNEFIRKIRLRNSVKLLMTGKYNVSEAAGESGFRDMGHFRECFREEYGMPPTEYLKAK